MALESRAVDEIRQRMEHIRNIRDSITVDADTHISDPDRLPPGLKARCDATPNFFHGRPISAEGLLREMELAGVDLALVWQNPAATEYTADKALNAERLRAANRYIRTAAQRFPDRFFPAGWTDPVALDMKDALAIVDECVTEFGFAIVKLNPAQNAYPIDSDGAFRLIDRIVELGAVPAFHFGADTPYTPVEGLERVARRHPDHPVIGIHFGGGGGAFVPSETHYHGAHALGLRQPNIFFIESAKHDAYIESDLVAYRLAGRDASRRIFLGSDCPYGKPAWHYGGFRSLLRSLADGKATNDPRLQAHPDLIDGEAAQDYLGRNFADFAVAACERLLATHQANRLS